MPSRRPELDVLDRAWGDIDRLVTFVARHPRGAPEARRADILRGFDEVVEGPLLCDVGVRRRQPRIELRRYNVRQFAIIYAHFAPTAEYPSGLVSIRAVRHSRVKDVFRGVREPLPVIGAYFQSAAALPGLTEDA